MVNVVYVTERSVMIILPCAIVVFLARALGEKVTEPVEAALPGSAALGDPLLGAAQHGGLDAAGPLPAHLLRPDKPAGLKHLNVLDDRCKGHFQRPAELADRCLALAEPFHHEPPARIGERPEDPVGGGALVKHVLSHSP